MWRESFGHQLRMLSAHLVHFFEVVVPIPDQLSWIPTSCLSIKTIHEPVNLVHTIQHHGVAAIRVLLDLTGVNYCTKKQGGTSRKFADEELRDNANTIN